MNHYCPALEILVHRAALVLITWISLKLPRFPEHISCLTIIPRIWFFITTTASRADFTFTALPSPMVVVEELAVTTIQCTLNLQIDYFMVNSAFFWSQKIK